MPHSTTGEWIDDPHDPWDPADYEVFIRAMKKSKRRPEVVDALAAEATRHRRVVDLILKRIDEPEAV